MKFVSIFMNRLRVLFSDKLFILALLAVPTVLSLIAGYAQRQEKLGYIPVALVDEDKTDSSELLSRRLQEKEGLKAKAEEREEAMKLLENNDIEAVAIIEKGFEKAIVRGKIDDIITLVKAPSSFSSELLKEIIAAEVLRIYLGDLTYEWLHDSFEKRSLDASVLSREDIREKVESYWEPHPIMTITYEEVEAIPVSSKTITIPSYAAASLGLLILFIMLGLLFGSGWLCEEKANGTLQRILSVKGAALPLFLANVSALFTMGMFLTTVFVLTQRLLFDVEMLSGPLSWLVISLYVFCAASVSMLLAAIFKTPHQLQGAAPFLALFTGLMGGCLWNLIGVPESLLTMALLTPQGWALRALTGLYAAPGEWSLAISAVLILLGASLIFLVLSYASLRKSIRNYASS